MAGAAAGVVLVSALVLQVSSAAFTGSTSSGGNSWGAGSVSLSNDRAGAAMFTATGMVPGDTDQQCILVTYTGSIDPAAPIALHAVVGDSDDGTGDGLSDDLDVVVDVGPDGSTCADLTGSAELVDGTLRAFAGPGAPLGTGWTPDASGGTDLSRPFLFTVTLGTDTPQDAQGDGATADFVWSATS